MTACGPGNVQIRDHVRKYEGTDDWEGLKTVSLTVVTFLFSVIAYPLLVKCSGLQGSYMTAAYYALIVYRGTVCHPFYMGCILCLSPMHSLFILGYVTAVG